MLGGRGPGRWSGVGGQLGGADAVGPHPHGAALLAGQGGHDGAEAGVVGQLANGGEAGPGVLAVGPAQGVGERAGAGGVGGGDEPEHRARLSHLAGEGVVAAEVLGAGRVGGGLGDARQVEHAAVAPGGVEAVGHHHHGVVGGQGVEGGHGGALEAALQERVDAGEEQRRARGRGCDGGADAVEDGVGGGRGEGPDVDGGRGEVEGHLERVAVGLDEAGQDGLAGLQVDDGGARPAQGEDVVPVADGGDAAVVVDGEGLGLGWPGGGVGDDGPAGVDRSDHRVGRVGIEPTHQRL